MQYLQRGATMWIEDASPFPFPSSLGALDCRAEDVLSCSREIKGDRASGTMVPVVRSNHCREEKWCHWRHPRKHQSSNLRGKIKHSCCYDPPNHVWQCGWQLNIYPKVDKSEPLRVYCDRVEQTAELERNRRRRRRRKNHSILMHRLSQYLVWEKNMGEAVIKNGK